ncbi:PHNW-like protein [Mya arenaria]|uniref:Alanine--glyoxylate aminotransferase n=1 Tax=Mya arenaria TaxID=6604 RepID=A0ABY7FBN3_MYAAR|nr:2-aminoethylphosphonate--pyruvate transaminase-like [Mya arenaria]WAR19515.1 PHNW-like protein [Mya arenaria]
MAVNHPFMHIKTRLFGIRRIWRPLAVGCRHLHRTSAAMADKKLFTPGPLGTSETVKQAMLRDLGSRDLEFISIIKKIRAGLLDAAGVSSADFTVVPMQGSGTFAVESVFQTACNRENSQVLCISSGAYGARLGRICEVMGLRHQVLSFPEDGSVDPARVEAALRANPSTTMVAIVHCETSSGIINDVITVGKTVKAIIPDCDVFVDGMSSFGAVPLDVGAGQVDYLVSSANKCLQGVPGFAYIIARLSKLQKCKGNSRSLSLDAYDQWDNLERTSQFRFTPPTHTMLAFSQAMEEFQLEGGVQGRAARYKENCTVLKAGMREIGFKEFLAPHHDGYIITSFCFPKHKNFNFNTFYTKLNERDQVIYPGKVLNAECFRIGNIGHLFPADVRHLLGCIQEVCKEMDIPLPITE